MEIRRAGSNTFTYFVVYHLTWACLQGSPKKKGHHRTGSAPPLTSQALLLSPNPVPSPPGKRPSLQDIPEHQALVSAEVAFQRENRGASVRFPDQSEDQHPIISRVLESPTSTPNSTPRALDSPTSTPRQGDSVIEHHVSDDNMLSNMLAPPSPGAHMPTEHVATKERITVPRLSLPAALDHQPAGDAKESASPESQQREASLSLKSSPTAAIKTSSVSLSNIPSIDMPSTPPLLGVRSSGLSSWPSQLDDPWLQQQPIQTQPAGIIVAAAAGVVPGVANSPISPRLCCCP